MAETEELRAVFDEFDADRSGSIDATELMVGSRLHTYSSFAWLPSTAALARCTADPFLVAFVVLGGDKPIRNASDSGGTGADDCRHRHGW